MGLAVALFSSAALLPTLSSAQAQGGQVYRCPGPPVLYTDAISAAEARERGCRTIEGTPVTVVQMPKPRANTGGQAATPTSSAPRPADTKVDPSAQRERDSDARRILEAELKREESKLAGFKAEYKGGEPDRQGNERNYQMYLDRVAALKASIARTESDIAALKRELAKLGG